MKIRTVVSIRSLIEQILRREGPFDVRRFSVVHTELDLMPFVFLRVEEPQVVEVLCYWMPSRDNYTTGIK
jgi:hypothetical protein